MSSDISEREHRLMRYSLLNKLQTWRNINLQNCSSSRWSNYTHTKVFRLASVFYSCYKVWKWERKRPTNGSWPNPRSGPVYSFSPIRAWQKATDRGLIQMNGRIKHRNKDHRHYKGKGSSIESDITKINSPNMKRHPECIQGSSGTQFNYSTVG